jgi:hypothetical protein
MHNKRKKNSTQHTSTNQCLLRYGRCSCDLCSRCFMCFSWFSAQFSALRWIWVRILSKILGFSRISWEAFSILFSNNSKSLIGAEYAKVFSCSHSQKSRGLRSGDRAGQLTGPLHLLHSPKLWFRLCFTMRRKWGGAPSCMNHMCCWRRGTCSKSTGESFTKKQWYTAPVSLLGKTTA